MTASVDGRADYCTAATPASAITIVVTDAQIAHRNGVPLTR